MVGNDLVFYNLVFRLLDGVFGVFRLVSSVLAG